LRNQSRDAKGLEPIALSSYHNQEKKIVTPANRRKMIYHKITRL